LSFISKSFWLFVVSRLNCATQIVPKRSATDTQSWAIMPGDEKAESGVSDACAKQLSKKN
jgi:hypothetical protein